MPDHSYSRLTFEAEIALNPDEIEAGLGSIVVAIQNVIGHTGAVVLNAAFVDPPSAHLGGAA